MDVERMLSGFFRLQNVALLRGFIKREIFKYFPGLETWIF